MTFVHRNNNQPVHILVYRMLILFSYW